MIESGYAPGVLQSHLCHLDKASETLWNYKLSQKHFRVKSIIAQCRRGYVPKQVKIIFITFHSLFLFLHDEMYFGVGPILCGSYFRPKCSPRKPQQTSSKRSIGAALINLSVLPTLLYAIQVAIGMLKSKTSSVEVSKELKIFINLHLKSHVQFDSHFI